MLFWAISSVEGTGSERLLLALFGAATFAAMAFIAEGVRGYNCWAWFTVMGLLVLFFGPALLLYPGDFAWPVPVSYAIGVMTIGWVHWLWTRRGDFLPDPRIDSLRRRRRRVTGGWRMARLAGLAAAVPRRPAAPVAGALWAQRCGRAG